MSARPTIEKEIIEAQRRLAGMDKEIRELRDYINASERGLSRMSDALQKITQEGIGRARADLARRELEAQRLRDELAQNSRLLAKMDEITRKEHEVARMEQEQERLIALLEQHRADLLRLRGDFELMVNPISAPPCEVVLPNNQRIVLDPARGEYIIGSVDSSGRMVPDINLTPFGGTAGGISRRHASLRYSNGTWQIVDLESTNGTFVNNHPIPPNTPFVLQDKTTIRIGKTEPAIQVYFRFIPSSSTRRL